MARESIERFSRRKPDPDVLEGLIGDMRYVAGAFDDDSVYAELERTLGEFDQSGGHQLDRVFYLSTAPQFFPVITEKLGTAGLNKAEGAQTRIVIEKPFGYDLASARAAECARARACSTSRRCSGSTTTWARRRSRT